MSDKDKETQEVNEVKILRPKRIKLTPEEIYKRMDTLLEREEQIVAAVRKRRCSP